jgi:hypothetical protein
MCEQVTETQDGVLEQPAHFCCWGPLVCGTGPNSYVTFGTSYGKETSITVWGDAWGETGAARVVWGDTFGVAGARSVARDDTCGAAAAVWTTPGVRFWDGASP